MQIAFTTLGCKVNQFDSAMMEKLTGEKSHQLVEFDTRADIYVINTCTVTQKSNYQSRQLIRKAIRQNPEAKIIVTGCYAETHPDEIKEIPGVSVILGNAFKTKLLDFFEDCGNADPQILINGFHQKKALEQPLLEEFKDRSRAFLKIQDGCNYRCSFCIIPKARGHSRSLPLNQVVSQINHLVQNGYQEVVLTGVYLGAYGRDLQPKTSLSALLREIAAITPLPRIRLSSIDPKDFDSQLIDTLKSLPNFCQHLHIPIQNGDDFILRKMRRGYSSGYIDELIWKLKNYFPDLYLGSDIMVGFPGEEEVHFQNTFNLLDTLPISAFHVFPYSNRPGTPASTMRGQVSELKKRERARKLRELSKVKEEAFKRNYIGKTMSLLMLKGNDGASGISHNYLKVQIKEEGITLHSIGQLREARIEAFCDGELHGRLLI